MRAKRKKNKAKESIGIYGENRITDALCCDCVEERLLGRIKNIQRGLKSLPIIADALGKEK